MKSDDGLVPKTKTAVLDADALRRYMAREARLWGSRVKARRKQLGFTLDQVAALAFTTAQTIYKIEEGEIVARDHVRIAVAFALGCEPSELFPVPTRAAVLRDVA